MKNNAFAHQIYLTAQVNTVFLAIYQDIGIQIPKNVKTVNKMLTLTQVKRPVSAAHQTNLYGMEINVFPAQLAQILIPIQVNVSCVLQDLVLIRF